ncbi:MAG: aminotransferase class I/II-fold pyridoxal phosphate-dependent enzyme [Candidatus Thorarchaeota archaeon]|nr:aminotransferase class I/II-fold pyridoxal phosphate-dependent enzyme [Candidatus Thorarchaeota archaeon]
MKLKVFELERLQSEWEHRVQYNLSESGVEPLHIRELTDTPELKQQLLDIQLGYPQTNGSIPLREAIAQYYPGSGADHILVTNGGAEANFLSMWWLRHEKPELNELVFMAPNYMQMSGVWKTLGGTVNLYKLQMAHDKWSPDLDQLRSLVTKKTAAITICNPNNPTGAIFDKETLGEIVDIAREHDTWIISDEIYKGAEIQDVRTPSLHGMYDKVIITSSLSKAYGLPGLRLGWAVCPDEQTAKELWSYSDYTTICPAKTCDWLATLALNPKVQAMIRKRTRDLLKENWGIMKNWLDSHGDLFEYVPPSAAAICFIRQKTGLSSLDLVFRLMKEKSVLISPGEHFEMPGYLRIGFGSEKKRLQEALGMITEFLNELS